MVRPVVAERVVSTRVSALATAIVTVVLAAACGDLKVGDGPTDDGGTPSTPSDGSSTDTDTDARTSPSTSVDASTDTAQGEGGTFPAGKGPGPHGSLPSGYCCTADSECRYRHCVDTGAGGKMCLDECEHDVFCTRPDITFTCDATSSRCKPSAGFRCLPAAGFTRGTKPLGACCNAGSAATNDGTAGSDCEGNQCAAVGSGPLVCTNRCSFESECGGGFACILFGSTKACVPTSDSYTCN
jgi:hypothetical protein